MRHGGETLSSLRGRRVAPAAALLALHLLAANAGAETVLVQQGSNMSYLANSANPGIGLTWTNTNFNDASWGTGIYGVGYDTSGAAGYLRNSSFSKIA